MKKKIYVTLVAIAVLGLAGWAGQTQTAQPQRRSSMQTWEYRIVNRARNFNQTSEGLHATNWDFWSENGKTLPLPVDISAKLTELGAQGWELVSITPRAGLLGTHLAGFTNDELWVFKRPKP